MKLTDKKRRVIFCATYFVVPWLILLCMWYVKTYHPDSTWWYVGDFILDAVLILFMCYLPKWLSMKVENTHRIGHFNEKIVLNGRPKMRKYILYMVAGLVDVVLYCLFSGFVIEDSIELSLCLCGTILLICVPILVEAIYRAYKNTYTIEGKTLIVDEWAWFRRKTDHLVISIDDIESIRKLTFGFEQPCNIEIQVAGIRRTLSTTVIGEELYNALKERMG